MEDVLRLCRRVDPEMSEANITWYLFKGLIITQTPLGYRPKANCPCKVLHDRMQALRRMNVRTNVSLTLACLTAWSETSECLKIHRPSPFFLMPIRSTRCFREMSPCPMATYKASSVIHYRHGLPCPLLARKSERPIWKARTLVIETARVWFFCLLTPWRRQSFGVSCLFDIQPRIGEQPSEAITVLDAIDMQKERLP